MSALSELATGALAPWVAQEPIEAAIARRRLAWAAEGALRVGVAAEVVAREVARADELALITPAPYHRTAARAADRLELARFAAVVWPAAKPAVDALARAFEELSAACGMPARRLLELGAQLAAIAEHRDLEAERIADARRRHREWHRGRKLRRR